VHRIPRVLDSWAAHAPGGELPSDFAGTCLRACRGRRRQRV